MFISPLYPMIYRRMPAVYPIIYPRIPFVYGFNFWGRGRGRRWIWNWRYNPYLWSLYPWIF